MLVYFDDVSITTLHYINSKNNIADLGTKRRAKLSAVLDNSIWVNRHDWAKLDKTQFPIQSFEELKLNKEEIKGYENEILKSEMIDVDWINKHLEVIHSKSYAVLEKGVPDKVGERYLFSRYIMDPNKFRFRKVVRIVALIILFVKNLKIRIKSTNNPNTGLIIKNEIPAQFKFHVFSVWFRAWLTSYVPTLVMQPKWFCSDRDLKKGDVVLFLKSDKEFNKQYQFGMISDIKKSRDLKIRQVEIEYQNYSEKIKRRAIRGTREIVMIHPVDELGLIRELNLLSQNLP